MSSRTKHLILFSFSLALLLATLFVSRKSDNREQIKNLELGYPIAFMAQDLSFKIKEFSYFPTWQKFDPLDRNCPVKKIFWPRLLVSLLTIFLSLEILIYVLESVYFKIKGVFRKRDG